MNERRKADADRSEEALAIDLADIEDVSAAGRRISLTTLNKLSPVGKFGKYHLLGRLAYGGMAEIFLAREVQVDAGQERLGRFCVVKRVLPHVANDRIFTRMFIDEARLVVQLSHPNICHVYAYGEEDGASFIAMEWVNGMPLSKTLRRSRDLGGLALPIALKIVATVAEALDHAHRAVDQNTGEPLGIVHRDVSPQNIMVAYDGVVKLLDFGIAKAASHSTRTEAGVVKGKFAYMSPQQCMGEPIDARSDVFALGVVMYELIDGTNPFKKGAEFDTMRALVYDEPPSLLERQPSLPPEVDAIVKRAIAKKPEDRFQSASEMQLAIERALGRMGEVVTAAHIGSRMHELFENEVRAGPKLDTRISVPEMPKEATSGESRRVTPLPNPTEKLPAMSDALVASTLPPPLGQEPGGRRFVVPALIAIVLLLSAALVGLWVTGIGIGAPSPAPTSVVSAPPVTAPPPPTHAATPPSVAPAEALGTISVTSTPTGASVRLGDRGEVGTTPLEVTLLSPGSWPLRMTLDGYEPVDETVTITAGQRLEVTRTLVATAPVVATGRPGRPGRGPRETTSGDPPPSSTAPAPASEPGHLSINTRPWSRVFVGSRLLGTTPIGRIDVPSGTLQLRFVDRDGVEHTRSVSVPAGGEAREFFDLTTD
ncbi:MAG: serine/threonine-protein kinase [Sandaracinus sp.]